MMIEFRDTQHKFIRIEISIMVFYCLDSNDLTYSNMDNFLRYLVSFCLPEKSTLIDSFAACVNFV